MVSLPEDAGKVRQVLCCPRPAILGNGQAMYWGAFWTPLSSMLFDGITILNLLPSEGSSVRIQLGYPSESHFTGEDPRSNPTILRALEEAGKLK
jgi:hypothetical protein